MMMQFVRKSIFTGLQAWLQQNEALVTHTVTSF